MSMNDSSGSRLSPAVIVLTLLLVIVVAAGVGYFLTREESQDTPGDTSAEAGFARDMILHHNQAVEMAIILQNQGDNPTLKAIALDIILTQQNQIGQMQGWLNLWGLPYASNVLPMTWMDMATSGLMPGMANDEQMQALRSASGTEADLLFIQLMIAHHEGGIHMADAIMERTEMDAVKGLASSISSGQQREIKELQWLAEQLGGTGDTGEFVDPDHEGTAEPDATAEPPSTYNIEGVQVFLDVVPSHREGIIEYEALPPHGGPHNPIWQNCGVYDAPVLAEYAVHSMEHGAVWLTYQPDLAQTQIDQLAELTRASTHRLLSPLPGIDSPIILTAWNVQLRVENADDPRIQQFLTAYEQGPSTPEFGAPCSGGQDKTAEELAP